MKRIYGIVSGILIAILIYWASDFLPIEESGKRCIAVVCLMITWWVSESVSLAVTALIPIATFPFFGILPVKDATSTYSNPMIFLFLGGFILGLALEKWNLHLRIALNIIKITGTNINRLIFGFMLATWFLSMWISNVATTVMMLPIALSILKVAENQENKGRNFSQLAFTLIVSIAYSANIGGVATIVGTPPNALMASFIQENYMTEISFTDWIMIGFPFSLVLLIVAYLILVKVFSPNNLEPVNDIKVILNKQIDALGPMSRTEWRVIFYLHFYCSSMDF